MDDEPAPMRDEDRTVRADGTTTTDRPMHEPASEYEHGREDEAAREGRFERTDETARTDEPTTTRRDA